MEKLQNKDVRTLHNELKTEHTKHTEGLLYNGELREAAKVVAKNTLDALKKQWQNILDSDCDGATKKKLETKQGALVNEIITYTNTIANTEYLFSHDKHLNQLAQRIDNAENEITSMIEDIWRKQELQAMKETIGSKYFKELPKWWLELTAATNAPRIDQVLGKLIQPNKVWKIDYSWCTNEQWKSTMIQALGWLSSGYISQGIDAAGNNTFVIKDLQWNQLNQRAIIREWVTLYPSEAIVDESVKQQNNKTNKLQNIDVATKFKQASELWKYPWLAKALWNKTEKFITLAEEQLHNVIVDAKKHGWELHSEPITKINNPLNSAIIEAHLINETGEKDVDLFTDSINDATIYDILDGNESDLVAYMTSRLKQKWNEYGHLDKVNTVAVWMQEKWKQTTMLNDNQKEQVKQGLQWLTTMVNNMIDAEGDTIIWSRDEKLRALSSYLRDVTAAVATWKKMTQYDVDKFSGNIAELYKKAFNEDDTSSSKDWIERKDYDTKKDVTTILLWTPQQAADAIRLLWERTTLWSNTNTSFLADDIANNVERVGWTDKNGDWKITDDEKETRSTMEIKETEYNTCFQNIEKLLHGNTEESRKMIDNMYTQTSPVWLFNWFQKNNLLPESAKFTNPLMRDGWPKSRTEAIFNQLKATEKQTANVDAITANARKGRAEEKRALESKWMLSDNEMQQLQVLHVLELHPDKANEAVQGILTSMKYQSVANLIRWQLTPWLVKEWGWVTWPNANTYNDIVWAWWFDFSDANAVTAQWMMVMMVEEIWSIVVAAALIASVGGAPAGLWILATKFAQWWKRIDRFVDAISELKYIAKLWKLMNKTALTRWMKNVWKGMVKSQTLATAGLSQGMLAWERSIKDGWIDHQIDAFTLWFVQKLGMISVLQAVTSSATTWTLSRVFAKMPDWTWKVPKQISAQVLFEEVWMAGTDFTSSLLISDQPFTLRELADNLLLGVVFEAIPWVKKVIINRKGVNVDGKVFTNQQAKTEISKQISNPDVKKAVEAKMKQYEWVKNLNEKKWWAYAKDASDDVMKAERDRLNKVAEKLQDGDPKKEKINSAVRKIEERINNFKTPEKIADAEKYIQEVEANLVNVSPKSYKKIWESLQAIFTKFPKLSAAYVWIKQLLWKLFSLSNKNREWLQSSKYGMEVIRVNDLLMHADDSLLTPSMKAFKAMDENTSVVEMRNAIKWMQRELKALKFTNSTGKNTGKLIGVDGVIGENTANALQKYLWIKKGQAEVTIKWKGKWVEWGVKNVLEVKWENYDYANLKIKAFAEKFWFTKEQIESLTPEQRKELFTMLTNDPVHAQWALPWDESAKLWVELKINSKAWKPWVEWWKVAKEVWEQTIWIDKLSSILKKWNIITIDGVKHTYLGIKDSKAQFASQIDKSLVEISSLKELTDARFNLEPWNKQTNAGRTEQLKKLLEGESKIQNSPMDKNVYEISIEGLTISPVVASYFKNNSIPESVAKKLTPEDISNIDAYLTDAMYKDWYQGATREQMVQNYLRDVVVKRADVVAKSPEEVAPKNLFETKTPDEVAKQVFKETPVNVTLAKSRVEQFGEWLWKNAAWPTLKFMTDAIKWLKNIEFKFPSLKNQIVKLTKKLESMRIKWSVEKINTLQSKSLQEKVDFVEKFDLENASNQELIALYKMTGWKWDPNDWAIVTLKDWTNTLQIKLKSDIADHVVAMRTEIKKQAVRIEHNFAKTPELHLSDKEVVFAMKDWEQYSVFMWRSEYVIEKSDWDISFAKKWNDEIGLVLDKWKQYTIWRNHTALTSKIDDTFVSGDHMSIKVDENGNVVVKDLKTENQTVLRKMTEKSINTNNKKQKKIYN